MTKVDAISQIARALPSELWARMQEGSLFPKVATVAPEFEQLFRLSGVPFFREYTDHSFQHSTEVFQAACEMLSAESYTVISPEDLNIICLASFVHDSGLHISEDVFLRLTDPANDKVAIDHFDSANWPELWTEFLAEAKRFSAKKLVDLFGDTEPVREPPRSALDMTQRDRLLIGEFLRRHHPRYAHEFARGLIDDANGRKLDFLDQFEPSIQDIVGLVARSHGILRATFSYIDAHFDLRDFNRIHIVYIMVVLRIADYLQIQPARAPTVFNRLHRIKSPYSAGEWRVHQSIENINTSSLDPEAVYVAAAPKTVHSASIAG
jgi:molecular chaperone HtpG